LCKDDGAPLSNIIAGAGRNDLGQGMLAHFVLSSKPERGYYLDYYEKMTQYAGILTGYAKRLDQSVTPTPFNPVPPDPQDNSVFLYPDTASSRAEITALTPKLEVANVAIVGLGGTGAYILDFLAKTPIRTIHLYDGDRMRQHNAFRAPGAMSQDDFTGGPAKVAQLALQYSPLRGGLVEHRCFIDEDNVAELKAMDFVFVAVDSAQARRLISERLAEYGTPFIDVGMGVDIVGDALTGQVRSTLSEPETRDWATQRLPLATTDANDDYSRNIQIVELNALNAAIAVIKWKKRVGFYADLEAEHHAVYQLDGNNIINERPT
jgi:hypothetical protein